MKLFKLIKNYRCRVVGNANVEILGLYHKHTEVKNGGLFFCLRGTRVDGVEFLNNCLFVPKEGEQAASDEGQAHEKA